MLTILYFCKLKILQMLFTQRHIGTTDSERVSMFNEIGLIQWMSS